MRKVTTDTSQSLQSNTDTDESSSDGESDIKDSDFELEIPVYYRKQVSIPSYSEESNSECTTPKNSKKSCILQNMLQSPDVLSALDPINLLDTKFTILAAAIAKADGQDLDEGSLSRSTVYRKRSHHCSSIAQSVKTEFSATEKSPLVVHWDGKLMKDQTNKSDPEANIDGFPVGVTGYGVDKVLGVAKLSSGTGEAQARATV